MKQLRPYQQEVLTKLKSKLKETDYPLLVNASVGAGKSLIIAELLKIIEKAGWRALCLTMNSTLIRQNAETYKNQGGNAGIYCASLGMKDTEEPIIFASPLSVRGSIGAANRGIIKEGKLSRTPFNLIIIDECHNINVKDEYTTYIRIFDHYKSMGHKLRFVGLTGTPYRGKGHTIVGEDQFFKEEVCAITAEWLIQENYLTHPVWGYCEKTLQYDFQQLKINSLGRFNSAELENAIQKTPRLTAKIMAEVTEIVKNRKGAFIFASSVKHCQECAEWLPYHESAIITGNTSDKWRDIYIEQARSGKIKYLINVNVLTTGIDVPNFDTVVFVRPTESLVLYMQAIGRGLRLSDGKTDCLILDYAGNLERHGDIDNPLINKALQPKNPDDPEYCIECFECNSLNTLTARRCIGNKEDKRCDHWFEWKDCPGCGTKNDIVSRQCRECKIELLDPNRKLNELASIPEKRIFLVKKTKYFVNRESGVNYFSVPCFNISYFINKNEIICEKFLLCTKKSVDFFYHTIAKLHFKNIDPNYYSFLYGNYKDVEIFLTRHMDSYNLKSPHSIECIPTKNKHKPFKIVKKHFDYGSV